MSNDAPTGATGAPAPEERHPDFDHSSLKHQLSFSMRGLIRPILSAFEGRDCSDPHVFAIARKQVLDLLNDMNRDTGLLLDRYEVVEKTDVQQIAVVLPDCARGRGMLVSEEQPQER